MRNIAYHFTVEDNGIYYKDRNLVHKRNLSFEFGELVFSMKQLVSSKRRAIITTWWWPRFFPYTENQEEEEETEWFSEELTFIYQPGTLFPCCLLIPREIKYVVPNQDIWMGKILSVPRQVTESIVQAFICLYLRSNTEKILFSNGWSGQNRRVVELFGASFAKVGAKVNHCFKGTDSLDTSIWDIRSFAISCSLLVKIIQTIEKIHVVKCLLDEK